MSRIRLIVGRLALVATVALAALAVAGPVQAAPRNWIYNDPSLRSVSIGVSVAADGYHDQLLAPGKNTSQAPLYWDAARGFFIGDGFCAQIWKRSGTTGSWTRHGPDAQGPSFEYLTESRYWKIVPYRARTSGSCV
ncbi:hypothetical protein QLQ12_36065 [Actinoplanes sp. NEAU-A12]|uniref:Uncharacterized protein n=1 Tax=Actinoplanes sandaracinus TaxID=3045177 RepID=A0ABT6WWC0_9ACTN|nr:hypothetical protein [Actinoplanes sandaracinus]MDI6104020.1 hypothetical protein [Actinoplanes sandaracinus]